MTAFFTISWCECLVFEIGEGSSCFLENEFQYDIALLWPLKGDRFLQGFGLQLDSCPLFDFF